ncbi:MAG: UPF0280 family protein [Clostridiaceae bacterium]|nr:UPF0280 family protein [Clostridiaceae bacterium]
MYQERLYRNQMLSKNFIQFNVTEFESDLQIISKVDLKIEACSLIKKYRMQIQGYIQNNPSFLNSLTPITPKEDAPDIVKHMCLASLITNVGPMATVAGALSQYVGLELLNCTDEIIIENGGDVFLSSKTTKNVLVYAGCSPLSNKIALKIPGENIPLGICTSSGTLGHSLSFGKADAVVVIAKDTLLADAAATSICNMIQISNDIESGISYAKSIYGIDGLLIIIGDKMGAWGEITLVRP